MQYQTLTVGREFGCGSGDFARALAATLGWKLFDRELIDEVARAAHLDPAACRHADEHVDRWLHRIGQSLWNAAGEKGPATVPATGPDADFMAEWTRRVIEDLAAAGGCVLVGRGGNHILRHRPDAFHVFLYAPFSWRLRRLESQGMTAAAAEALLRRVDHDRAAYIRRYFQQDWPHRSAYHLMLNASLGPPALQAATLAAMQA
jgi:hypothetical protein